jgi:transcription elongation factor Elf1
LISKYEREEKARYDKEQFIFTKDGYVSPNLRNYAVIENHFHSEKILICPFCLKPKEFKYFLIKNNNKFMAKCPNCKQQVQFKTLINMLSWTGKEFADFVFPYSKMGFWKKVYPSFHDWKNRLIFLGLSTSFWERYKALKGEYEENES